MNEQQRKDQLTDLTGGLRCRCPGNEELVRVECRHFNGVRHCYFACAAKGSTFETRYPVGVQGLCRCSLGTQVDPDLFRSIQHGGDLWGFGACKAVAASEQVEVPQEEGPKPFRSAWPAAIAVGALFWYVFNKS